MLSVKMPRLVFPVVHPDDDAKEDRNDWHKPSVASSTDPVGPMTDRCSSQLTVGAEYTGTPLSRAVINVNVAFQVLARLR
jgi:hypothetical protein